ncbi:hypothetical protein UFOVP1008_2 [uncultured Caudovirales phage]|uniref:Uncharacterized protein n=1 Tax=uncultured Caudovirales phage TaxID=2100421 RepID=A0A6J5Q4M4_9CAUD|nr:hypothetical protein UFOVP498_10 [uncultured Caudovirales phage]CAB4177507.1 hypothetical protein UFOVP1008_2 [uncultured Caudovirales phage]CAB4187472.1 hypothetical protein UFOVP1160_44 [uncultured Caudovirales phage]CAB4199648.1 hypothetical protein UFOVP1352_6 [uncultured Caudovirales phage]
MIYIPGQTPSVLTGADDLILWVQTELERISALSRIQEEDIAAAGSGSGTVTGVRWDLDECYSTTSAIIPVWDINGLTASAAYADGIVRFEGGAA